METNWQDDLKTKLGTNPVVSHVLILECQDDIRFDPKKGISDILREIKVLMPDHNIYVWNVVYGLRGIDAKAPVRAESDSQGGGQDPLLNALEQIRSLLLHPGRSSIVIIEYAEKFLPRSSHTTYDDIKVVWLKKLISTSELEPTKNFLILLTDSKEKLNQEVANAHLPFLTVPEYSDKQRFDFFRFSRFYYETKTAIKFQIDAEDQIKRTIEILQPSLREIDRIVRVSLNNGKVINPGLFYKELGGLDAPKRLLKDVPVKEISELESGLKAKIIDQSHAIDAMIDAVHRARIGLNDSNNKTDGVYLYAGTTGIGKTELARELARSLYGNERALVKLDMAEFGQGHMILRLTGSPPSYVGYGDSNPFQSKLKTIRGGVVIFDEIEKADSSFYRLCLSIFDEGYYTNGQGEKISLKNFIIIMTSNLGAKDAPMASSDEEREQIIIQSVRDHFRPEFINRIDKIVVFNSLSDDARRRIIELRLEEFKAAANRNRGIELSFTPPIVDYLLEVGINAEYGARPLRRAIDDYLETPIAKFMAENGISSGAKIKVSVDRRLERGIKVEVLS